ncbi:unnamed protein product [Sordaria macrospora k-hell]|uniref:WGS project CABT00000000 data, contig 2.9 n=1 Tax=Sordaria macrospora (strain ATCC MYA-333 / DSM 997 / K(L3346) / K-hell) TaxID=771870 RepID=F7VVC4_SORMK|nr:uncharacterized protein SMAC_03495 [Sordaria macrospora k-hell]KAH7625915.1 hypothetical protein B0T09DRAFT_361199 [Sordaria sp. MPI-SDFR-AT-0083]CCC09465.1 unnamed protein product [Sordaria macrospora k-hell]
MWGEYTDLHVPSEEKLQKKSVSKPDGTALKITTGDHQNRTVSRRAKTGIETYDVDDWWEKWYPIARAETRRPRVFRYDDQGRPIYNPYCGSICAWQARETADAFLARTANIYGTFVRAVNPYAPPRWKPARDAFTKAGKERLQMFSDFMDFYGSSGGGSTGKRDLGNIITERAEVMRNLTRMASACEVVAGKWLLYIPHDQAEEAWRKIVTATVKNELGSEAIMRRSALKDKLDMEGELIKVYTHDYRDKLAAARVLEKLKTLGVLNPEKEYYYKSDALSHLNLFAHNRWGLKTSLYSSTECFELLEAIEEGISPRVAAA